MNFRYPLVIAIVLLATYLVMGPKIQKQTLDTPQTKPQVHFQAPVFQGKTLEGEDIALGDYPGKPIFLNFWASWCPPCKAEMPDLISLHERYEKQVAFIGINTTFNDSEEAARDFASLYEMQYPIVVDPQAEISKAYQIIAMPTSFILDDTGRIVFKKIGPLTIEEFERAVKPLLKEGS
ncbi:redoxin domain-containing protein [Brevibacillus ruminantium]|uniref:Redoxin domain-containing protein n=1 Tax=Brevibacillus ruminantium TaxID=2950604 RepID=A0ABY4W888_9BACL|nr:redoxin domain-containing protein [Brevibacillus ruminantium]USG63387.1 redoxin domain-containing protein [Brevibacillus ruminantium]